MFFKERGFVCSGFLNLTPNEAYREAINNHAIIVDVREYMLTGYKKFDVPAVIYIPNSELRHRYHELPKDKPLIIADSVGLRSKEAILFLLSVGYTNAANLAGGIVEWERDHLPLIIDNSERLDGSCMCQLRPRMKSKNV
ncbi:MAG: rhodanese-like domain-containing protein [Bacteroidales bacterium]|nr:rhodanese-like domain-containing protein [Bacteroidales bacterium]